MTSRRPRPGEVCVPISFAATLAGPLSMFVRAGRLREQRAVEFVGDLEAVARLARPGASTFGLDGLVLVVGVALARELVGAIVAATDGLMRAGVEVPAEVVAVISDLRDAASVRAHACGSTDPADELTMVSVTEIHERTGLHRNSIRGAIGRGTLPAVRTPAGFRVSEADAAAWRARAEEEQSA